METTVAEAPDSQAGPAWRRGLGLRRSVSEDAGLWCPRCEHWMGPGSTQSPAVPTPVARGAQAVGS